MAVHVDPASGLSGLSGVRALFRRDLAVFIPRDRFLVALVYLLAHPTVLPSEEAFFWLGIILAGTLTLYVPIMEWHQETDRMLNSLPVTRATVVLSRYLSSLLACGVAGTAWVSTGNLLAPLFAETSSTPALWATPEGWLTFLVVALLLVTLFLPLYFRFGLGRGGLYFLGSGVGLFLLWSVPSGPVAPGGAIRAGFSSMVASIGAGWVLFLVLGGLGAAMALSGRVSTRWFQGRDL